MKTNSKRTITVKVRRGGKKEEGYDTYEVPFVTGQSVLGVLQYITDHLDPTLAYNSSCRIGLCDSCLIRVNGKVVRACTTLVKGDLNIEPYKESVLIRDLVADLPQLTFKRDKE